MFERYTEAARRVVFYSRYLATQGGSQTIGTEHLLLGLLRADMALARRFLGSPWAAEEIWRDVERKNSLRTAIPAGEDLPLSPEGRHALLLAAKEADQLASRQIRTDHLLLGLLRDEKCYAAELLNGRGLHFAAISEELSRNPHDDSGIEKIVREPGLLPDDVLECHTWLKSIVTRMEQAISNHDFEAARSCSDDERAERVKLRSLYEKHGLLGWMFE
jgi:ATP-dependent Clp protease ATP-binding subunit ClpC